MYTYLLINVLTVLIPVLLSFERRVRYVSKWKYALAASFLSALVFLPWDYYFVARGVWGFNGAYLTGVYLANIPLEEVLFFFTVPFSCIFIYEVVGLFTREDIFAEISPPFIFTLIICCGLVAFSNMTRLYTASVLLGLAGLLIIHLVLLRVKYLGRFFIALTISLIPMVVVNGLLTNGVAFVDSSAVVWYNNAENLALRVQGIPVEDFAYWFFLFLMNITWYEYLKRLSR